MQQFTYRAATLGSSRELRSGDANVAVRWVEPMIGHLKSDNRMGRCFLKGVAGDEINAVLSAAGSNLQKLLRAIARALIFRLVSPSLLIKVHLR